MRSRVRSVAAVLAGLSVLVASFSLAPGTAQATGKKKYSTSIAVSDALIVTGDTVTVKGKITPYYSGSRTVYLQQKMWNATGYKTVATARVNSRGEYAFTVKAKTSDDFKLRVKKSAYKTRKTTYTKAKTVVVDPKITWSGWATRTVVKPNPEWVSLGEKCAGGYQVVARPVAGGVQERRQLVDGNTFTRVSSGSTNRTIVAKIQTRNLPAASGTRYVPMSHPCVTGQAQAVVAAGATATLTLTGFNLDQVTEVVLSNGGATVMVSRSAAKLTVTVPGQVAGSYQVLAKVVGRPDVAVGTLGVMAPPAVAGLSASSGPLSGGGRLTITGTDLADVTKVEFQPDLAAEDLAAGFEGAPRVPAKVLNASAGQVVVQVPAGLGGLNTVHVTTKWGTATATYTYVAVPRAASAVEQQVVTLVNQQRAQGADCRGAGVYGPAGPVAVDGMLNDVALSHASDMAWRDDVYTDASRVTLETYGTADQFVRLSRAGLMAAENVDWGVGDLSAAELVSHWMKSPGTCATVMAPSFSAIGVGVVQNDPDPEFGTETYAVVSMG